MDTLEQERRNLDNNTEISNRKPVVLAVDDQLDSLRLLQLRLKAAGMDCVPFQDAMAALDYLKNTLPDLIILDVMMPEIDGFELCRRLKQDERTCDIPVLFLTAKNESADKVEGLDAGGHDYLSKPVEQQELLARTRAALRVKQLNDKLKEQLNWQRHVNQLHSEMLGDHWQKTLGILAGSLAHEINNPLAAALGNIQLLASEPGVNESTHQKLQIVDQSLQRAAKKLRSLLLIAQPKYSPQIVSLNNLIDDLITLVNHQLVIHGISLTKNMPDDCTWTGYPGELIQALLYLMNNAIEASIESDDPQIHIRLTRTEALFNIEIRDNGKGIPDSIIDKLFTPFFSTKNPPHHGVGLFLAKKIIEAARGCIACVPNRQKPGAAFCVTLPQSSV